MVVGGGDESGRGADLLAMPVVVDSGEPRLDLDERLTPQAVDAQPAVGGRLEHVDDADAAQ